MAWIASLWSSSTFWEGVEYFSEAIVIIGASVEVLADFERIFRGEERKELRHRVGKYAAIALIIGLGIELGALVRTNQLFTETIASLYGEARDASDRATVASNGATRAENRADEAEKQAGDAIERAALNSKEAARLNKIAQDEALARLQLQKLVSWRTITEDKKKEVGARLKKFPGVRIAFTVNAGDPEGFAFGTQIAAIAIEAGWQVIAFAPITNLGQFRTGVTVTTTGDRLTMDASDTLVRELNELHFDAKRSPEIDPRDTDALKRPLMYVFVELRPQAVPNKVSEAIARQK